MLLSFFLISENGLNFVSKFSQDYQIDFEVRDSHWHPYQPSITLNSFVLKNNSNKEVVLEMNDLHLEFDLIGLLIGRPISALHAKNTILYTGNNVDTNTQYSSYFATTLLSAKNLLIENFVLKLKQNDIPLLSGNLIIQISQQDAKARFYTENIEGGFLDIKINSSYNSVSSNSYKGFLETNNFEVNNEMLSAFCFDCSNDFKIDSKFWFSFVDSKLVSFEGETELQFQKMLGFIDNLKTKIRLEDPTINLFKLSSYINKDKQLIAPDAFISLNEWNPKVIIPQIDLQSSFLLKLVSSQFKSIKNINLKGRISDVLINLDSFSLSSLNGNFNEISFQKEQSILKGLKGSFIVIDNKSKVLIDSPYVELNLSNTLDEPLVFNELYADLLIDVVDGKLLLSSKNLEAVFNKNLIIGSVKIKPSPYDNSGDISTSLIATGMSYDDAFSLFPNLYYTSNTKDFLKKSISCGIIQELGLIYRGPINNKFKHSTSSFQLKGTLKDSCLDIYGSSIRDISILSVINNDSFKGEIFKGDIYGSVIEANIETNKQDDFFQIEVEGSSSGPLYSIVQLIDNQSNSSFSSNISGEHDTNFSFISPLSNSIGLLSKGAELRLNTKVKNGSYINKSSPFIVEKVFSSIDYDSLDGVKEGFLSFKYNSEPIRLNIKGPSQKGKPHTLLVGEENLSVKNLIPYASLKRFVKGSSTFNIELKLPAFTRGAMFISPELSIESSLKGIELSLAEPFVKTKNKQVSFNLSYFPINRADSSQIVFKYGDILRGKVNLLEESYEGFLIAGRKKQSITIEKNKLLLIGDLNKLDLGKLINSGTFISGQAEGNFFIKSLNVAETSFSNLTLSNTRYTSLLNDKGNEIRFENSDVTGTFTIPKDKQRDLSIQLDFIKLNQSKETSQQSFLTLFNNINTTIEFKTDALIFNSTDYGNWKFLVVPNNNALSLINMEGKYGKWGLKRNKENNSTLEIIKTPLGWASSLETQIYSGSPEKGFKQIGLEPNFELDKVSLFTDIRWSSLPWNFNYSSFVGEISFELDDLTIENDENIEMPNNFLRLINIFNITDSFEKVTNLDFRKLYKRGFSADNVKGSIKIRPNSLEINDPIIFTSGSSEFRWKGTISRASEGRVGDIDLEVIMTLPLREYLPAYALILGGPITAGVVYIAGKAFERNLDKLSSGKWLVTGSIDNPKTDFQGWFEKESK